MEPKHWEGEKKAGLIKAKFDELYSKHFQNQSGVLSFPPPQASPTHPQYPPPPAAPTNQSAKPSTNPQSSARPVKQNYPREPSQVHSEGFSQPARSQGTSAGERGAGLRGWPPNENLDESLRRSPQNSSHEDLQNVNHGEGQSEEKGVSGQAGSGQAEGGARGLTRDVDGARWTGCREEGLSIEREADARGPGGAVSDVIGLQSRQDVARPHFKEPVTVAGALPEGALPKLSWAQLPDGATVIVVSPNLVANPKLRSGGRVGSQVMLQGLPEAHPILDGGNRLLGDGRSSERTHSGSLGELGMGVKRESEAGEVIQGGPKRLQKGRGEAPSGGAETGSAHEGIAAAKSEGDLHAGTRKDIRQEAKGMRSGLDGPGVGHMEKVQGRNMQLDRERKPQGLGMIGSRKERKQVKTRVENTKISKVARELQRLAETGSKPGVKREVKPGVKKRRMCSLAALVQESGDASGGDAAARPSKKRKLVSSSSSLKNLAAAPPLPTQKALLGGKPPAVAQAPNTKPLAAETGLLRLQQQTTHREQCKTSGEPVSGSAVKPADVPKPEQSAKNVPRKGVCEPTMSNLTRRHEAGLAGKRRSEALEALAAAAPEPMCRICYTEYDARRCYLACDSCDRWYHAESFGFSPEAAVALMKFKCPTCMRRGRPSGCPVPSLTCALAAPLKIRPKLHQKARIVYESRGLLPGAQRAGLGDPPEQAQVEKRKQRLRSKSAVVSGRNGIAAHELVAAAISRARGGNAERLFGEAHRDFGKEAKTLKSCETAVEETGDPPAMKRPPLRLVGGTHPANLRNGELTSNPELPPEGFGGCPPEERSSGRPFTPATSTQNGASEVQGASECAALLAQPSTDSACVPKSAQAAAIGTARGSPPLEKKASAVEVTNEVPLSGTASGAGGPGSTDRELGGYGEESTAGGKAQVRGGAEPSTGNGTRKRIQPTKLGPLSQPAARNGVPKAGEARGTEAAALLEGPAVPRSAEHSWNSQPAQSAAPQSQGPQGHPAASQAAACYQGGPVLPSVGRYSWEAAYYRAADEAFREEPVLPDRIHTGAPRGQSARWSIDLSKVQEVDGRKVRMGTEEIDGVQQLS